MDIESDKLNRALVGLRAFQTNPPSFWDESAVSQFHEVVAALTKAFERDLSEYRIPEDAMKPDEDESGNTPWVEAGRHGGRFTPVGKQMSGRRFCDEKFARRKLAALVDYIQSLIQNLQPTSERPRLGFQ